MAAAEDGVSPNQAPEFQEMVRKGDLPPLAERLPVNPAVVERVDGIGQPGGAWNTALVGGSDSFWLVRTVSYIHPIAWALQWDGVVTYAVEGVIAGDDDSEYTFIYRCGGRNRGVLRTAVTPLHGSAPVGSAQPGPPHETVEGPYRPRRRRGRPCQPAGRLLLSPALPLRTGALQPGNAGPARDFSRSYGSL